MDGQMNCWTGAQMDVLIEWLSEDGEVEDQRGGLSSDELMNTWTARKGDGQRQINRCFTQWSTCTLSIQMEIRYSSVIGVMELKINSPTTLLRSPLFNATAHYHSLISQTLSWNISHVLVLHSRVFQRHYTISAVETSRSTVQTEAYCVKMIPWIPGKGSQKWVSPLGFT